MNADGSNVHQLTHTPTRKSAEPDWSPDGSQIVFTRTFKGQFHLCKPNGQCITKMGTVDAIFLMNADGSNVRQLTNLSLQNSSPDSSPVFSPDGQSIVFMQEGILGNNPPVDLFAMNADGSNQRRLTHVGAFNAAENPTWQPLH